MDLLFLHTPKFNNYYKPIGRFSFIELPPIGLLGLADLLHRRGHSTKIVHLGVERQRAGRVDIEKIIATHNPGMIGLDLHWHFQAFDVIETAKAIKKNHPEIAVLLGGFTASLFADEILGTFDCVDFIICGDAEVPLLDLLRHYSSDRDYHEVPNLAYRNGSVKRNAMSYVADQEMIESLCYTNFSLMQDYKVFVDSFSRYMSLQDLSPETQRVLLHWKKSYPVMVGRGCMYECSYCGGSKTAQRAINNRNCVIVRSVEGVLESLQDLEKLGFEFANIPFDAMPPAHADEFYVPLFKGVAERNIALGMEVERYSLPSAEFLQAFRGMPKSDESFVTLTAHCQNEELRRRNRLFRFSNNELEACLELMGEHGVKCMLFFTSGLPFETAADMIATARYQQDLQKRFQLLHCKNSMIEIEPCSGIARESEHFQVIPHRATFADYYRYHSQPAKNHFLELGYDRIGSPNQQQAEQFFCKHFCAHFRTGRIPPALNKSLCTALSLSRQTGALRVLDHIVSAWKGSAVIGLFTALTFAQSLPTVDV
ncbi:MAG TPA: cobalamin-dependent protein [Terriglobales bacterium]